ncbi:hypothetical protein SY85_19320 [Flavisolibacter tropicus]|uniref:Uncharacterized protein n=1 Tax=Flavisolibacter tropicus TaxID=1492898 RepID=A0A172U005_9BACT|nr:hypothetical protein SY85_19320 [Flavisolibacter tropicus]
MITNKTMPRQLPDIKYHQPFLVQLSLISVLVQIQHKANRNTNNVVKRQLTYEKTPTINILCFIV